MIVYNHVYINTDDCLALAEVHALWVLSSLPRWLEKQINLPALLKFYQHFGASGGIFPCLNTPCAIPQLFSTTPNQTSMCTERSLQIKALAEQEGERHKNNLWWGLLNESIIPAELPHDITEELEENSNQDYCGWSERVQNQVAKQTYTYVLSLLWVIECLQTNCEELAYINLPYEHTVCL